MFISEGFLRRRLRKKREREREIVLWSPLDFIWEVSSEMQISSNFHKLMYSVSTAKNKKYLTKFLCVFHLNAPLNTVPKCMEKEMCHMRCFCMDITPPGERTFGEMCAFVLSDAFKTLLYQRLPCIMKVRVINDALFSSTCGLLADVFARVSFTWFRV